MRVRKAAYLFCIGIRTDFLHAIEIHKIEYESDCYNRTIMFFLLQILLTSFTDLAYETSCRKKRTMTESTHFHFWQI